MRGVGKGGEGGPASSSARPSPPSSSAKRVHFADTDTEEPMPRPSAAAPVDHNEVPEVDIRAKAAWSDDEGFRVSPTRVAFKRRF